MYLVPVKRYLFMETEMTAEEAKETISKDIKENDIFLFMKGTPESPQCGFSAQVVQLLAKHQISYASRNVLEDWEMREGIKSFTNWPTIPQLYVKGKFVGGCDIVMDLERKGELSNALKG